MVIVKKHLRSKRYGKSIVHRHHRIIRSRRRMGWQNYGPGKRVFFLEKPEDREELLDIVFENIR